jgi:hypothetical protein
LTDKVFDQLIAGIAVRDALLFKNVVGEVGTCFESEDFRQDKGIVTVKEEIGDLKVNVRRRSSSNSSAIGQMRLTLGMLGGTEYGDRAILKVKKWKRDELAVNSSRK